MVPANGEDSLVILPYALCSLRSATLQLFPEPQERVAPDEKRLESYHHVGRKGPAEFVDHSLRFAEGFESDLAQLTGQLVGLPEEHINEMDRNQEKARLQVGSFPLRDERIKGRQDREGQGHIERIGRRFHRKINENVSSLARVGTTEKRLNKIFVLGHILEVHAFPCRNQAGHDRRHPVSIEVFHLDPEDQEDGIGTKKEEENLCDEMVRIGFFHRSLHKKGRGRRCRGILRS